MEQGRGLLGLTAGKEKEMFSSTYAGRRVFVTGHTGFKGSWLCAWLAELGAEVAGYSLDPPGGPSCFEALGLSGVMRDTRGDVRDADALKRAMRDFAPDVVFHLAAQALVRLSYEDPAGTFATNVNGTLNVLEALRDCEGVRAAVIITSDKCYRNNEWVYGYRETDRLGGADPYSASKGCAELVARSYFESFFRSGPAGATARAGNVIGGGDWAIDRIVPDCARAWAAGRPAPIRSPRATRPWQHVLEPLSGYLWLGACLLRNQSLGCSSPVGQAYNFGPPADAVHTVGDLVQALQTFWPGFRFELNTDAGPRECNLLKLCCDKALAELGWRASLDFGQTVTLTADWYREFYQGGGRDGSMRDFTIAQIKSYVQAAQKAGLPWSAGNAG